MKVVLRSNNIEMTRILKMHKWADNNHYTCKFTYIVTRVDKCK